MRILLAFLILSVPAQAGDFILSPTWGVEKQASQVGFGVAERLYGAGVIYAFTKEQRVKLEGDYWISRGPEGRKSSAIVAASWGYRVPTPIGFFVETYIGPAWISQTDNMLGSPFQIRPELGVGFEHEFFAVSIKWVHVSSGPIPASVNLGRDFWLLANDIHLF